MKTARATKAAEIRKLYKAKGWTSRQISVRSAPCTYSSSIDITIKDPTIPMGPVKKIAAEFESIRRCEASGEILGGGNTFVSVEYSREAREQMAAKFVEKIKAAVPAEGEFSVLNKVEGTKGKYMVDRRHSMTLNLWVNDSCHRAVHDDEYGHIHMAVEVAMAELELEAA